MTALGGAGAPHRIPVPDGVGEFLAAAARAGTPAQSYLFAGPPGVGKGALALHLAQALLCRAEADERPCGACRACRLVATAGHPDVHRLAVPLRIDDVRALQGDLAMSPYEGPWRVAVVPRVEQASPGAANSLLKTLEEPPDHVVLALTTGAPAAVLETIRSRCQVVPVPPRSVSEVERTLRAGGLAEDRARLLARLSVGRIAWAQEAAADGEFLARRTMWLDHLRDALGAGAVGRLEMAGHLAGPRSDLDEGLAAWRSWARDLLWVSLGLESLVNEDRAADLAAAAARYGPAGALALARAIDTAQARLSGNANRRLALEALLLELP